MKGRRRVGILQPLKNRKRQDDTYSFAKCIPSPRSRGIARVGGACVLAACWCAAVPAQAQSASTPAPKAPDSSLTWNGITLYGIVDVGVQYQTHGVPISDYFPAGTESIIQKNSNGSITAVTPSNLSQSRIGLSGNEPLMGDWSECFAWRPSSTRSRAT